MFFAGCCGLVRCSHAEAMKPCVLIAAPPVLTRRLADALGATFSVMVCSERERATALMEVACFQAIVIAEGFLASIDGVDGVPMIVVPANGDAASVRGQVIDAVERRKAEEWRGAGELARLTELEYDEYIELVRFRATRRYLLGLMRRHHGSVTDASRKAGMMRESLHRLLRRHDVEAERFRDDGEP